MGGKNTVCERRAVAMAKRAGLGFLQMHFKLAETGAVLLHEPRTTRVAIKSSMKLAQNAQVSQRPRGRGDGLGQTPYTGRACGVGRYQFGAGISLVDVLDDAAAARVFVDYAHKALVPEALRDLMVPSGNPVCVLIS